MKFLIKKITEEVCQNCIWWDGDSTGMQGQCNQTDVRLIVGRYEECVNFLARDLIYEFD